MQYFEKPIYSNFYLILSFIFRFPKQMSMPKRKCPFVKHHHFTAEEDKKLMKLVKCTSAEMNGRKLRNINWRVVAVEMDGRTPRQCRERYCNYLSPHVKRSRWTFEEDLEMLRLYSRYGGQWQKLKELIPGRSAISIRNRYFHLKRTMNDRPELFEAVFSKNRLGFNLLFKDQETKTSNEIDQIFEITYPFDDSQ